MDDGKRALAALEVGLSPLRANRGGVWGGEDSLCVGEPGGSVDDGKRRTAVLEVDTSPLRATKGRSLRGGRAEKRF